MANFDSFDGTTLYYDDQGEGHAVVLLHGFAADSNVNYIRSGILDALLDEGYRTIALDARGHGLSSKPTDPAAYADDAMRRDVAALLDHLALSEYTVVGYSMGAQTALRLAPDEPRIKALALLGIGESAERSDSGPEANASMLEALTADEADDVEHPQLRQFRIMAGMDREPLVALLTAGWTDSSSRVDEIAVPVILIVGTDDESAGDPTTLADKLHATLVRVPGDHFTANARPEVHRALLGFLAGG